MAFQDYFGTPIAYDPSTGELVKGATFTVHATDDVALATPLATTDPVSGAAITLTSSNVGVLPDFRVAGDPAQVILKSGSFITKLTSVFGAVLDAGLDPDTVAGVHDDALAAEQAKTDAEAAAESLSDAIATVADLDARLDAVEPGLHAQAATGTVTIPVVNGHTYELTASDTPVVTLSGVPGCQAAVVWSGTAGTLEGTAMTAGSTAVAVRLTAGWKIYLVGAAAAPDTTAPTAGSLSVAVTTTTADLTVTGALDETALHATPYRFSKDNGTTWSAWQSAATYGYTGLASGASFTFLHQVRDAAGNVKTGAAVVKSTDTAPTWTVWAQDDFTGTDGTIVGRTTPTGGKTWVAPVGGDLGYPTWTHGEYANLAGGKLELGGTSYEEASAGFPYPPVGVDGRVRVTFDYDLTVDTSVSIAAMFPSNNWPQPFGCLLKSGTVASFRNESNDTWTVTPGAVVPPASGTAVAECSRKADGSLTFQLTVAGNVILAATGTGTSAKPNGAKVQIGFAAYGTQTTPKPARVDNVKVEYVP